MTRPSLDGEEGLIAALRALATHPAARGLADDAAVLEIGTETLILTQDSMVEGIHYLASQDMADVGWKLAATNLSDLAAKGAAPLGVLYTHMLGANDDRFIEGLAEILTEYEVPLLGGDTVSADGPRCFSLTAIGRASVTPVPSRSGAQPGEAIYLTGPVGAAMMGFEALQGGAARDTAAYCRPVPLLAQGRALAPFVSAMMDVSDGLLLDAGRIAEASGVTVSIDTASVPLDAPETRRGDALRWGDDYQLLFTGPANTAWPIPVHQIGTIETRKEAGLLVNGIPPAAGDSLGFRHSR
ncbi:thiamine-phosphate kinase [Allopontixanthobacter sp.]|uniref:thiamine-phosphate kinase n=1 Tax=Allopontixanthobacter sp. TaxID=2906452 RepID=UPI002AB87EFB|nr:thiamine-phosphate kinase [Allopontixanthobacter sp.]MDZ4306985.1 thiamine-phosphate kinase [Allopontixanthobacter sp.]